MYMHAGCSKSARGAAGPAHHHLWARCAPAGSAGATAGLTVDRGGLLLPLARPPVACQSCQPVGGWSEEHAEGFQRLARELGDIEVSVEPTHCKTGRPSALRLSGHVGGGVVLPLPGIKPKVATRLNNAWECKSPHPLRPFRLQTLWLLTCCPEVWELLVCQLHPHQRSGRAIACAQQWPWAAVGGDTLQRFASPYSAHPH